MLQTYRNSTLFPRIDLKCPKSCYLHLEGKKGCSIVIVVLIDSTRLLSVLGANCQSFKFLFPIPCAASGHRASFRGWLNFVLPSGPQRPHSLKIPVSLGYTCCQIHLSIGMCEIPSMSASLFCFSNNIHVCYVLLVPTLSLS